MEERVLPERLAGRSDKIPLAAYALAIGISGLPIASEIVERMAIIGYLDRAVIPPESAQFGSIHPFASLCRAAGEQGWPVTGTSTGAG
jgi:hypothetical protein